MKTQNDIDFERIAGAIAFIRDNFKRQPTLEEAAAHVHLSPAHFQRMFRAWAGTSPKKLLQYVSVGYAKHLLRDKQTGLLDAALETGLSGTNRLHDLFVNIEGMTPAEYRDGGAALEIRYSFADSPFGPLLVASTDRGICRLVFVDKQEKAVADLKEEFPRARYVQQSDAKQLNALSIFTRDWEEAREVQLHLRATPFQLKVWESLLTIPSGDVATYGDIARSIGRPTASRAVGTAVGDNPIAFIIPCHRVIKSSGLLSGYRWGVPRKSAMLTWEACRRNSTGETEEHAEH